MILRFLKNTVTITLAALLLTACAHVNFWTALKFANVDFLDVNPDTARVALVAPEDFVIDTVGVSIETTSEGSTVLKYEVPLELLHEGPEFAALPASIEAANTVIVRLPRDEIARARQLQLQTAEFRDSDREDKGLAVIFNYNSKPKEGVPPVQCTDNTAFKMAVWVRLDAGEKYSRLISGSSFAKLAQESLKQSLCE